MLMEQIAGNILMNIRNIYRKLKFEKLEKFIKK